MGGSQFNKLNNLYLINSLDYGNSFTNPSPLFEKNPNYKNMNESEINGSVYHPSNVEITNNNLFFVVWQDSISSQNEDIFLDTNVKKDSTYRQIINLSNNSGISECLSIAISDQDIYNMGRFYSWKP